MNCDNCKYNEYCVKAKVPARKKNEGCKWREEK